ncbi:MAG: serine/threonine-protein kinase [Polyangiaceae bacterium]
MDDDRKRGRASAPDEDPKRSRASAPDESADEARRRAEKLVGTTLSDRYRIHNLLAMGGMGAVYTGEHVHMRKRVAIKLLHPDTENLPSLVSRFEREAIVGAHVEHPNIASARDFGKLKDGSYYLVLEFVRGITLRQLLQKGKIPISRALPIARQIASALSALHEVGIFHRDIAPRNVMVVPGAEDKVKLIDFGFAKVPVERFRALSVQQGTPILPSEITAPGVVFGTIGYLAPEAALGMSAVDERSDLYALGAIFYELFSGVPPFEAASQGRLFLKHRNDPVPKMADRAKDARVPAELEAIAVKLLEKRPENRYASARDVERALEAAAVHLAPESRPAPATDTPELTVLGAAEDVTLPRYEDVAASSTTEAPSSLTQPRPSAGGGGATKLALALAAVAVLAGGGWFMFGRSRSPADAPAPPGSTAPASAASSPAASVASSLGTAPADSTQAVARSAPPATSASAPRDTLPAAEIEAHKKTLLQAQTSNNWSGAADALLALAAGAPTALGSPELRLAATEVATRLSINKELGDKLIDALSRSFGADGIDVLYELVTRRGGSRAATMATEMLARPEVRARGSKALGLLLDLRATPCMERLKLLDRVRTDGDDRVLAILIASRGMDCATVNGGCCILNNADLESAIADLSKRLR